MAPAFEPAQAGIAGFYLVLFGPPNKGQTNRHSAFILCPRVVPLGQLASWFSPHPNLSDEVNHQIVQSEIEGGVFLNDLPSEAVLQIRTQNHCYTAVLQGGGSALISGHPQYCPQPVLVAIAGSTWGGSMLKRRFVGRGMHLEFCHPEYQRPIVTSSIQEIKEVSADERVKSLPALEPSRRLW